LPRCNGSPRSRPRAGVETETPRPASGSGPCCCSASRRLQLITLQGARARPDYTVRHPSGVIFFFESPQSAKPSSIATSGLASPLNQLADDSVFFCKPLVPGRHFLFFFPTANLQHVLDSHTASPTLVSGVSFFLPHCAILCSHHKGLA
jgi:hypothetical protein